MILTTCKHWDVLLLGTHTFHTQGYPLHTLCISQRSRVFLCQTATRTGTSWQGHSLFIVSLSTNILFHPAHLQTQHNDQTLSMYNMHDIAKFQSGTCPAWVRQHTLASSIRIAHVHLYPPPSRDSLLFTTTSPPTFPLLNVRFEPHVSPFSTGYMVSYDST